ncbi:MAG: hypothetical protein ACR2NP_02320, partial [Pirellulaceae bacterium]
MLNRIFLVTLTSLTLAISGVTGVSAQTTQEAMSMGPSARPYGSTDHQPFADADLFEYDAQLWAPYDVTSMDGSTEMHTGFYSEFTYAYTFLSSPEPVAGQDPRGFAKTGGYSWGRGIELGFMSKKDSGWSLDWFDYENNTYLNDGVYRGTSPGFGALFPTYLRTNYTNVTFNRQFRQTLTSGAVVEPFVGLRYTNLTDQSVQDSAVPFRFTQKVRNSAIGGQVGSRFFRQYGRFMTGSEASLGALYNDQCYSGATQAGLAATAVEFINRNNDFVPVFDFNV